MTLPVQIPRVVQTADGVQDTFSYDFLCLDETHMEVYENAILTTKAYTVTGVSNPAGGTVVFSPVVPANGTTVTLVLNVPLDQETDYQPYDPFPAETHEAALDKLTQISQQQQDEITRSLKAGVDTPPGVSYGLPPPDQAKGLYWENVPSPLNIVNGPSVTEIEQDKDAAAASATAAATSASNAAVSETSAANSASGASTSETNAAASETKAQEWAENPEDTPVEPGQYSALHWAAKSAASAEVKPGSEMFWSSDTPPDGWLSEDGAAYDRTLYAELFAEIGIRFGAGDGSTTFNVPDPRGRTVRVWNNGAGIDPDAASRTDRGDGTGGDANGTNQADAFKSHSHELPIVGLGLALGSGVNFQRATPPAGDSSAVTGGNETRMINTNRMMIIKY